MPVSRFDRELRERIKEAQHRVAVGEIDLREIGNILFGRFDQDLPARMMELALDRLTKEDQP